MAPHIEILESCFTKALADWRVPGMAVAIIKGGEVIVQNGYGVRRLGSGIPVDSHTMFALHSNTKAFTTTALAILVDEGKVAWDDPVRAYVPYFKLYDCRVSEDVRIRELLCHRTGLTTFSGELMWYETCLTPRQVIERMQYLQPRGGARRMSRGYTSLHYIVAGEIVRIASGMQSWDEFVQARILRPLDMTRTVTSAGELGDVENLATGHWLATSGPIPVEWCRRRDPGAATGGMISTASDMSKWLMLHLARGKTREGEALFSERAYDDMWRPHSLLRITPTHQELAPSTHFRAYGLGWTMCDYKGRKILSHFGEGGGMSSRVVVVPEEDLAFAILTNSYSELPIAMSNVVLDVFLGGQGPDWSGRMLADHLAARRDFEARIARCMEPVVENSRPPMDLACYAGRYHDKLYGEAFIEASERSLTLRFEANPDLVADLTHLHHDTFAMDFRRKAPPFMGGNLTFSTDDRANVTGFAMNVPSDDFLFHELDFRRQAPRNQ